MFIKVMNGTVRIPSNIGTTDVIMINPVPKLSYYPGAELTYCEEWLALVDTAVMSRPRLVELVELDAANNQIAMVGIKIHITDHLDRIRQYSRCLLWTCPLMARAMRLHPLSRQIPNECKCRHRSQVRYTIDSAHRVLGVDQGPGEFTATSEEALKYLTQVDSTIAMGSGHGPVYSNISAHSPIRSYARAEHANVILST